MSMETVLREALRHMEAAKETMIEAEVSRALLLKAYGHILEDQAYAELFTAYTRNAGGTVSFLLTALEKILWEITTGDEE